jgi:hypothetical protein
MSEESYMALVSLAYEGVEGDPDKTRNLSAFLSKLEKDTGITRFSIYVAWDDLTKPVPATVKFPETWPPKQKVLLTRYDRAYIKKDVVDYVAKHGVAYANILVTKDLGGQIGWQKLDDFFTR